MADRDDRLPENRPGPFYVDSQCIDCDLCRQTAPRFFQRNDAEGYTYVYRQPRKREDIAECQEALKDCPVDAIGCDGEPVEVPV